MIRLGVDIGGTFTDVSLLDSEGGSWSTKLLTTPQDPSIRFLKIVEKALSHSSSSHVGELVHATTIATNAILENKIARMGMITTAGFGDVLEIGRHFRRDLYNFFLQKPPALVPAERRVEVSERVAADGRIVAPLDEAGVDLAVTRLLEEKVEIILVCFLHSYLQPAHEILARAMIRKRCKIPVILSSEVCAEYREFERFSTATIHGAVKPLVHTYLKNIEKRLRAKKIKAPFSVMQSSGGICRSSGPTATSPIMWTGSLLRPRKR